MMPQPMTSAGRKNLAPIFLKRRLPASSAAIYGLNCWDFHIYDILGDILGNDIPKKDGNAGLILTIS